MWDKHSPKFVTKGRLGYLIQILKTGSSWCGLCLCLPACCLFLFECLGESRCILIFLAINLVGENVAASMHQAQYQVWYHFIWSCLLHWAQRKPPPLCGKRTGWGSCLQRVLQAWKKAQPQSAEGWKYSRAPLEETGKVRRS